jgi:hypothetical protein
MLKRAGSQRVAAPLVRRDGACRCLIHRPTEAIMTDTYRSCRTCHTATSPQPIESMTGNEKALAVTVRGLTVLACSNGHKQFVDAEFPLKLLNQLVEKHEVKLPAGEEKGVLMFKHFYCHDCGRELEPKPDHRHTFTFKPGLPDQSDLEVDLTMAVYQCSGCRKEQLHSLDEVRKLTPAALAHAFQAAGIQSG